MTLPGHGQRLQGQEHLRQHEPQPTATRRRGGNLLGVTVDQRRQPSAATRSRCCRSPRPTSSASRAFTATTTTDIGAASGGAAGSISGSFYAQRRDDHRARHRHAAGRCATASTTPTPAPTATGVTRQHRVRQPERSTILALTADKTGTPHRPGRRDQRRSSRASASRPTAASTYHNQLQAPQPAQFKADGLLDSSICQTSRREPDARTSRPIRRRRERQTTGLRDPRRQRRPAEDGQLSRDRRRWTRWPRDHRRDGAGISASVGADGASFRLQIEHERLTPRSP